VKGTLTVPNILNSAVDGQATTAFVGIDGANNDSAIQAGFLLEIDPTNPSYYDLVPFWDIAPNQGTLISSVDVQEGDSLTVTIWQVSGTNWEISLMDNTSGKSFTTPEETYTGPGQSAEWIVSAPAYTSPTANDGLAPYSPAIAFSGLGTAGTVSGLGDTQMVQGSATVATPSILSTSGFSVAFTGSQSGGMVPDRAVQARANAVTAILGTFRHAQQ
jgi:hypothetical protein